MFFLILGILAAIIVIIFIVILISAAIITIAINSKARKVERWINQK